MPKEKQVPLVGTKCRECGYAYIAPKGITLCAQCTGDLWDKLYPFSTITRGKDRRDLEQK